MIHMRQQIPLKPAADESCCLEHGGQQGLSYLDPSRGAGGLGCRTAEELLGSLSWAFWSRVCPTVSLLLAGSREASGGTLLRAHSLPGAEVAPIQLHTGQRCTGEAGASQMAGLQEKALLWQPYLSACAAGTAAPCRCPGGWQSGSPSGRRTSHPLSSSAHCRVGWWGQSGAVGAVCCAPTHPGCCHNPTTQAQWAKSAGDWAGTIHPAADRLSYILSKVGSKLSFVGQGRPKGRKSAMLETEVVQGAQGDAAVSSGGEEAGHEGDKSRV